MVAGKLLEHARITGDSHRFRLISTESLVAGPQQCGLTGDISTSLSGVPRRLVEQCPVEIPLLPIAGVLTGVGTDHCLMFPYPRNSTFLQALWRESISSVSYRFSNWLNPDQPFWTGSTGPGPALPAGLSGLVIESQRREVPWNCRISAVLGTAWIQERNSVSENSNAIRILTIHSARAWNSKLSWSILQLGDHHRSTQIEYPLVPIRKEPPFTGSPLSGRFSSNMKHTLFSGFYYQERMKGYLDSLNLMYVAFTRAVDVLYTGSSRCRWKRA